MQCKQGKPPQVISSVFVNKSSFCRISCEEVVTLPAYMFVTYQSVIRTNLQRVYALELFSSFGRLTKEWFCCIGWQSMYLELVKSFQLLMHCGSSVAIVFCFLRRGCAFNSQPPRPHSTGSWKQRCSGAMVSAHVVNTNLEHPSTAISYDPCVALEQ